MDVRNQVNWLCDVFFFIVAETSRCELLLTPNGTVVSLAANVVRIRCKRRDSGWFDCRHVTESVTSQQYCYVDRLHRISRFPALDSPPIVWRTRWGTKIYIHIRDTRREYKFSCSNKSLKRNFGSGWRVWWQCRWGRDRSD